jgi:hypothetical protein
MDLYENFQGLKHNFEKVQGCFCKITRAGQFLELMNYFSIKNWWNRFTVCRPGPRRPVHRSTATSLNQDRPRLDQRHRLNTQRGIGRLIVVVDAGMDDPQRLGRQGRRDCGSAPAPQQQFTGVSRYQRSDPLNTIRCSPTASG